jgi:hypothetical protein
MDETTRIILTRAIQILMFIPIIFAFRQLYKDVHDNQSDTHKDSKRD